MHIGDIGSLQTLADFIINSNTLIQIAQLTPLNAKVQNNKTWHILSNATFPAYNNNHIIIPLPTYSFALPPKYPFEYSYYTNGSFHPPEQISINTWRLWTTSYGIFNPIKDLQILEHLPRLQNIQRAELMTIYTIIKLSITSYIDELIYIFTDSWNSLYLINTQIRYPFMQKAWDIHLVVEDGCIDELHIIQWRTTYCETLI